MIEGIKVEIMPERIREHCRARATYHRERSTYYAQEAESMREKEDALYRDWDPNVTRPQRQSEQNETRARQHEGTAQWFDVIAEYVIHTDVYRFTNEDLVKLEFITTRI